MISACLKKQKKSLDIKCPSGSMVQILRAFYGYSPSGSCQHDPNENNCTLDEEQNYPCTGRESCSINLPSGNVGRMTNRCNNTNSNYFQVEYKCVKGKYIYIFKFKISHLCYKLFFFVFF